MYYPEHHYCEMPLKTRVFVQFRINIDGSVTIANVRSPDEFFEIKAREIIQKLPSFIPGKHQGKPVAVYFFYPILFKYD
ncbi:energy transducer TonB [Capnocytophaga canimorsus]|uniref:energy transducer TonB n=1 Tax=Capnocytophaga canimorsus TaxID=28188 RepID=UPI003859CA83